MPLPSLYCRLVGHPEVKLSEAQLTGCPSLGAGRRVDPEDLLYSTGLCGQWRCNADSFTSLYNRFISAYNPMPKAQGGRYGADKTEEQQD